MKALTNIFILFLVVSIICCTKKNDTTPAANTPQTQDYRAHYLGDYYCNGTYTNQSDIDTSMVVHIYMLEGSDSNILISSSTLFPDTSTLKLNTDETFRNNVQWRSNDRSLIGNFINDSIYFSQSSYPAHKIFEMKGKKI